MLILQYRWDRHLACLWMRSQHRLLIIKKLIQERVGTGIYINLNPDVEDLPQKLAKDVRGMKLLVMGTISGAGAGCGCAPNALLKALLAYMILRGSQWMIVDLEAGVEHLGRGTISSVDGLVVVSEPSIRGLQTASNISRLAKDLGLKKTGPGVKQGRRRF